jgi:hypothetical protein
VLAAALQTAASGPRKLTAKLHAVAVMSCLDVGLDAQPSRYAGHASGHAGQAALGNGVDDFCAGVLDLGFLVNMVFFPFMG